MRATHQTRKRHFGPRTPSVGWGGLSREGVRAKKFGMSLEKQGEFYFWAGFPGKIAGICRKFGAPTKVEKNVCVKLLASRTDEDKHLSVSALLNQSEPCCVIGVPWTLD